MRLGYVLLDGAADRPHPKLNFTTPLHAAITPNLDFLASKGEVGSVYSVRENVAPESDVAVLCMLGYDLTSEYPGRGVIEAMGSSIEFRDGMLALRANFATYKGGKIIDRRAGRDLTAEETKKLEKEISGLEIDGAKFIFKATVGHRGVLVISSDEVLSSRISNTDPAYTMKKGFGSAVTGKVADRALKCLPLSRDRSSVYTSRIINEFIKKAFEILSKSEVNEERIKKGKMPANYLLLRDPGMKKPNVKSFSEKFSIKGRAIVDMPVEIGIAKILGLEVLECRNLTLEEKADLFVSEIKKSDFVYIHIKGPDEYGHDGNVHGKKKSIQEVDLKFFSKVRNLIDEVRMVISCDHATPCILERHASDPVPILVTSVKGSYSYRFAEVYSKKNIMGIRYGKEILPKLLKEFN